MRRVLVAALFLLSAAARAQSCSSTQALFVASGIHGVAQPVIASGNAELYPTDASDNAVSFNDATGVVATISKKLTITSGNIAPFCVPLSNATPQYVYYHFTAHAPGSQRPVVDIARIRIDSGTVSSGTFTLSSFTANPSTGPVTGTPVSAIDTIARAAAAAACQSNGTNCPSNAIDATARSAAAAAQQAANSAASSAGAAQSAANTAQASANAACQADGTHCPAAVDTTARNAAAAAQSSANSASTAAAAACQSTGTNCPAYTGDASSSAGSTVLTFAPSGVTAGTYGAATAFPIITVDAKGRITSATQQSITLPGFSGDVTSHTGSTTLTLAASGVTAGTYGSATQVPVVTVDAKGRVTGVSTVAFSNSSSTSTGATPGGNNYALQYALNGSFAGASVSGIVFAGTGAAPRAALASDLTGLLGYTPLQPTNNLSDLANVATARNNLGLGNMALQNSSAVSVTGWSLTGISSDNIAFYNQSFDNTNHVVNQDFAWSPSPGQPSYTLRERVRDTVATYGMRVGLSRFADAGGVHYSVADGDFTSTVYATGGWWHGSSIGVAYGGTGASDAATARNNLGLGNMAVQSSGAVSITGGPIFANYVGAHDNVVSLPGQGGALMWNISNGQGETDFVNNRGGGVGAWYFVSEDPSNHTRSTVATIDNNGNASFAGLSVAGLGVCLSNGQGCQTNNLGSMASQNANNVNITGGVATLTTLQVNSGLVVEGSTVCESNGNRCPSLSQLPGTNQIAITRSTSSDQGTLKFNTGSTADWSIADVPINGQTSGDLEVMLGGSVLTRCYASTQIAAVAGTCAYFQPTNFSQLRVRDQDSGNYYELQYHSGTGQLQAVQVSF